jgi:hypothetical protein
VSRDKKKVLLVSYEQAAYFRKQESFSQTKAEGGGNFRRYCIVWLQPLLPTPWTWPFVCDSSTEQERSFSLPAPADRERCKHGFDDAGVVAKSQL